MCIALINNNNNIIRQYNERDFNNSHLHFVVYWDHQSDFYNHHHHLADVEDLT